MDQHGNHNKGIKRDGGYVLVFINYLPNYIIKKSKLKTCGPVDWENRVVSGTSEALYRETRPRHKMNIDRCVDARNLEDKRGICRTSEEFGGEATETTSLKDMLPTCLICIIGFDVLCLIQASCTN